MVGIVDSWLTHCISYFSRNIWFGKGYTLKFPYPTLVTCGGSHQ